MSSRKLSLPPEIWAKILASSDFATENWVDTIGQLSYSARAIAMGHLLSISGITYSESNLYSCFHTIAGLMRFRSSPTNPWNVYRRGIKFQRALVEISELFNDVRWWGYQAIKREFKETVQTRITQLIIFFGAESMEGKFLESFVKHDAIKHKTIFEEIKNQAEEGYIGAMDLLGFCFLWGIGVLKSEKAAEEQIKRTRVMYKKCTTRQPPSLGCWCQRIALKIIDGFPENTPVRCMLRCATTLAKMKMPKRAEAILASIILDKFNEAEDLAYRIILATTHIQLIGPSLALKIADHLESEIFAMDPTEFMTCQNLRMELGPVLIRAGETRRAEAYAEAVLTRDNPHIDELYDRYSDDLQAALILAQLGRRDRALSVLESHLPHAIELRDLSMPIRLFRELGLQERGIALLEQFRGYTFNSQRESIPEFGLVNALVNLGVYKQAAMMAEESLPRYLWKRSCLTQKIIWSIVKMLGLLDSKDLSGIIKRLGLKEWARFYTTERIPVWFSAESARVFGLLDDTEEAVTILQRVLAVERERRDIFAMCEVGRMFARIGMRAQAMEVFKEAHAFAHDPANRIITEQLLSPGFFEIINGFAEVGGIDDSIMELNFAIEHINNQPSREYLDYCDTLDALARLTLQIGI